MGLWGWSRAPREAAKLAAASRQANSDMSSFILADEVGQRLCHHRRVLELRSIEIADLEAQAVCIPDLEMRLGCKAAEDGVLPSEFVRGFLDAARIRPGWLGCWAILDGLIVGSGGYKSKPIDGVVEIGYGVAPSHEGQGIGTAIAGWLKATAFSQGAATVRAHTLSDGLASQAILKKSGFTLIGEVFEEDDGLVLRWEAASNTVGPA